MTIESIIVVDTETTGLDPAKDKIIEVAAVLYSVRHRCTVMSFSTLARAEGNAAEAINRIPASAVEGAPTLQLAWNRLREQIDWARIEGEAIFMAHRATFDHGFLAAEAPQLAAELPWVCSKFDVEWPYSRVGSSCVEMALAHGVPVVSAHRALTDCMLITNTLDAVVRSHDLPAILARAMRPKATFQALVSFEEREKAKSAGFRWDPAKKTWERTMAIEDAQMLGFKVRTVEV